MIPITAILVSVAPNSPPSSASSPTSPRGLGGGSTSEASTQAPMAAANGASCCRSARQASARRLGLGKRGSAAHMPPRWAPKGKAPPPRKRRRGGRREAAVEAIIVVGVARGQPQRRASRQTGLVNGKDNLFRLQQEIFTLSVKENA